MSQTYPPDHVHETKKVIADRLGVGVKLLTRLMAGEAPPPVEWCRARQKWLGTESPLAEWERRQHIPAREAQAQGLARRRRRPPAGEASVPAARAA